MYQVINKIKLSTWILANQKSKTINLLYYRRIAVMKSAVFGVCCQSQEDD